MLALFPYYSLYSYHKYIVLLLIVMLVLDFLSTELKIQNKL